MLATDSLLKALSEEDNAEGGFMDSNDDQDFGKVLDFYASGKTITHGHTLKYADGQERVFSFDN